MEFDQAAWREHLQHPDWYLRLASDYKALQQTAEQQTATQKAAIKEQLYSLIESVIADGTLPLAQHGPDLDVERQPIDTAVIHHTANQPGMSLARLNAMQLLRIYGGYYANPTDPREKDFKGQPVWSGHFYENQQVFWGYHWLVRQDGSTERLLPDTAIGWQAGNWDINTRSVGICIDDDLTNKVPAQVVLDGVRTILQSYHSPRVLGHCEVLQTTVCPGELFVDGWKNQLTK